MIQPTLPTRFVRLGLALLLAASPALASAESAQSEPAKDEKKPAAAAKPACEDAPGAKAAGGDSVAPPVNTLEDVFGAALPDALEPRAPAPAVAPVFEWRAAPAAEDKAKKS